MDNDGSNKQSDGKVPVPISGTGSAVDTTGLPQEQGTAPTRNTTRQKVDAETLAAYRREFKKEMMTNDLRCENACYALSITPAKYRDLVSKILAKWEFTDEGDWTAKHLFYEMQKELNDERREQQREEKRTAYRDRRSPEQWASDAARTAVNVTAHGISIAKRGGGR